MSMPHYDQLTATAVAADDVQRTHRRRRRHCARGRVDRHRQHHDRLGAERARQIGIMNAVGARKRDSMQLSLSDR